jgi:hypothetical protein
VNDKVRESGLPKSEPQPSKGGKVQILGFEEKVTEIQFVPFHERVTVNLRAVKAPIRTDL